MRLSEYYRGIPLHLLTRLPPDEVARRINAAVLSPFRPFATGIVGHARPGWVRLFNRTSLMGYKGMPLLSGPIELHPRGTLLRLLYRGRLATRLAFPLAYLAVFLGFIPAFVLGGAELEPEIGPILAVALAMLLLLVLSLPLAIHTFAIRNAEAHLETIAAFLRTTLDARDADIP